MEVESHISWGFDFDWGSDRPDWKMSPLERSQVHFRRGDMSKIKRSRARQSKKRRKDQRH